MMVNSGVEFRILTLAFVLFPFSDACFVFAYVADVLKFLYSLFVSKVIETLHSLHSPDILQ